MGEEDLDEEEHTQQEQEAEDAAGLHTAHLSSYYTGIFVTLLDMSEYQALVITSHWNPLDNPSQFGLQPAYGLLHALFMLQPKSPDTPCTFCLSKLPCAEQ